ncbi:helix-turn-helix domain-containing protein [Candidatus Enterococcus testudinis]|uniref:helix-turn-helix domain-containing protein n=1 Tax=Candidatus Enterococcus testudinis TaxID=1834191 RepID=UPI0015C4F2BE
MRKYSILCFSHQKPASKIFCEKQYLSRATVFRKLSVIKEILAPFHLQFNINKLELIGSELAI